MNAAELTTTLAFAILAVWLAIALYFLGPDITENCEAGLIVIREVCFFNLIF